MLELLVLSSNRSGYSRARQRTARRRELCLLENPIRLRMNMLNKQTQKELAAHQAMPKVLRALQTQVGVGERDIARLTNTEQRTVRRWLAGAPPRGESAERVDELRVIVTILGQLLDPDGIVAWLRNRNEMLEFRRPLEILAEDDNGFETVLDLAKDLVTGAFA